EWWSSPSATRSYIEVPHRTVTYPRIKVKQGCWAKTANQLRLSEDSPGGQGVLKPRAFTKQGAKSVNSHAMKRYSSATYLPHGGITCELLRLQTRQRHDSSASRNYAAAACICRQIQGGSSADSVVYPYLADNP